MFSPQPDQTLKPLKHAHSISIFKLPPSRVASPSGYRPNESSPSSWREIHCPLHPHASFNSISQGHKATARHRGSQQVTAQRTSELNIRHHYLEHGCFYFIILLETALLLDSKASTFSSKG